jgi:hydroxyacylglutathione hydrolase
MVKMIYRRLELPPIGTNCYIVGSDQTHDGMVIDPAGDAPKILDNIKQLTLEIKFIIVTHTHPDHIGAIAQVKEATGASFALHVAEAGLLRNYDYSQFSAFDPSFRPPPPPEKLLNDGDSIEVGDLSFRIAHTPGHSMGGICIIGHGVVFSGDTLFNMGIGRTDGPGGDYNTLISGIRNKLFTLPDNTLVLPGHGPKTTIGYEKQNNPFFR